MRKRILIQRLWIWAGHTLRERRRLWRTSIMSPCYKPQHEPQVTGLFMLISSLSLYASLPAPEEEREVVLLISDRTQEIRTWQQRGFQHSLIFRARSLQRKFSRKKPGELCTRVPRELGFQILEKSYLFSFLPSSPVLTWRCVSNMYTLIWLCLYHKSYNERMDSRVLFAQAFSFFFMGEVGENFIINLLA